MLLPDATMRSPTTVPAKRDVLTFAESVSLETGWWKWPPGLVDGDFAIQRLGVKLYREEVGFGTAGYITLVVNGRRQARVSQFVVASHWPNLYKLEVPVLVCRTDTLEVETYEPLILTMAGCNQMEAR